MATKDSLENEMQLVVFGLGDEEFGVEITQVREIIRIPEITKMPNSPDFVDGVINLRGTIAPIVDLKKLLDIHRGNDENTDTMRIVIVEHDERIVGMIVDGVSEVLRLSKNDIDANPILASDVSAEYISGVGKLENRLLILIDMTKIMSADALTKLNEFRKKLAQTAHA